VPLLGDTCSRPRPSASTTTLVLPAEVFTPPSCTPPSRVGSVDKLVAESTSSEQLVQGALDHTFNASCPVAPVIIGASSSALAGGLGSCLAYFSRMSTSPVPPPSSFLAADATGVVGCKDAPWELAQPRCGMRSKAVASPTLKTRPPVWHRCHEVGQMCCEPLGATTVFNLVTKQSIARGKLLPALLRSKIFIVPGSAPLPAGSRSLLTSQLMFSCRYFWLSRRSCFALSCKVVSHVLRVF
jgi:hypothetical protein